MAVPGGRRQGQAGRQGDAARACWDPARPAPRLARARPAAGLRARRSGPLAPGRDDSDPPARAAARRRLPDRRRRRRRNRLAAGGRGNPLRASAGRACRPGGGEGRGSQPHRRRLPAGALRAPLGSRPRPPAAPRGPRPHARQCARGPAVGGGPGARGAPGAGGAREARPRRPRPRVPRPCVLARHAPAAETERGHRRPGLERARPAGTGRLCLRRSAAPATPRSLRLQARVPLQRSLERRRRVGPRAHEGRRVDAQLSPSTGPVRLYRPSRPPSAGRGGPRDRRLVS